MPHDPTEIWTGLAHVEVHSGSVELWFRAYTRCFVACASEAAVFDSVDSRLRENPLEMWNEEAGAAEPTTCRLLGLDEVEPLLGLMKRRELTDSERNAASWALQDGFCTCDLHTYPEYDEEDE